jgi:hypothetical protein
MPRQPHQAALPGPDCRLCGIACNAGRVSEVRLLRAALAEARQRGAVQAVVVTAQLDEPKREALRACGLEVASEWWVTPQGLRDS